MPDSEAPEKAPVDTRPARSVSEYRTHSDSVTDLFEAFCLMQKTGGRRRLEGEE